MKDGGRALRPRMPWRRSSLFVVDAVDDCSATSGFGSVLVALYAPLAHSLLKNEHRACGNADVIPLATHFFTRTYLLSMVHMAIPAIAD